MISLKQLLEGISYLSNTNKLNFSFDSDFPAPDDNLIYLKPNRRNSRLYNIKGFKIFYGYYFNRNFTPNKPSYFKPNNTQSINDARTTIKHVDIKKIYMFNGMDSAGNYTWTRDESPIIKMIDLAIERFSELVDLNSFTSIISAPSSSRLNDLILDRFQMSVGTHIITKNALQKNEINQIAYFMDEYNKLSDDGKRKFHSVKNGIVKKTGTFEMKHVPPTMRSLFHNFISLKQNNQKESIKIANKISNGKVLIIDDTIGTGGTFLEIVREIKPLKPKEIYLFGLLQDYYYSV